MVMVGGGESLDGMANERWKYVMEVVVGEGVLI